MEPAERRAQGAHYTTEKNILKVIEPLFLDDLRAEFHRLRARKDSHRRAELKAFHERLGKMKFFDPACGCGNFLIIAYRELRELEIELLRELHRGRSGEVQQVLDTAVLSRVTVDQFYGIELGEFAARIAETALWMMDHIMNNRLSLAFGQSYVRIPLEGSPPIRNTDALEVDWEDFLPPEKCSFVFGNPPFGGAKFQSEEQRIQVRRIAALGKTGGTLDYVTAWFIKAGKYVQKGSARIGFVATNSITQGEQVAQLWPTLFEHYRLGDCLRAPYVRLGLGTHAARPTCTSSLSGSTSGIASGQRNACSAIPTPTANRKKPGTPLSRRICLTPAGSPIRI